MGGANRLSYFTIGPNRASYATADRLWALSLEPQLPPLVVAPPLAGAGISREELRARLWLGFLLALGAGGLSSHKRFLAERWELRQPQAWATASLSPPLPQGFPVRLPSDATQVRQPRARLCRGAGTRSSRGRRAPDGGGSGGGSRGSVVLPGGRKALAGFSSAEGEEAVKWDRVQAPKVGVVGARAPRGEGVVRWGS